MSFFKSDLAVKAYPAIPSRLCLQLAINIRPAGTIRTVRRTIGYLYDDHCRGLYILYPIYPSITLLLYPTQYNTEIRPDLPLYLGVTTQQDLKYGEHVTKAANKAGEVLGLCQRNLKHCPERCKELHYFALVRSFFYICVPIWDPYLAADKSKLETSQRSSTERPVWQASFLNLIGERLGEKERSTLISPNYMAG